MSSETAYQGNLSGLCAGGLNPTAASASGYLPYTDTLISTIPSFQYQKPYIRVNFVGNGALKLELSALKCLVDQLERDIENKFGRSAQSTFASYSRSFGSPDRSENYSFGA